HASAGPESSDLGQSKVHENDTPLNDMEPEVNQEPRQDEASDDRPFQKLNSIRHKILEGFRNRGVKPMIELRFVPCKSFGQSINQVIHQSDIASFGALDGTRELGNWNDSGASPRSNSFCSPAIQVKVDQDNVRVLLFHARDHVRQVRRGGRNPWFWLQEKINFEAEPIREVSPGIMVGDDTFTFAGSEFLKPLSQLLVQGRRKTLIIRLICWSRPGIQFRKCIGDVSGDDLCVYRID